MYIPESFHEIQRDRIEALMRDYPFGLLVSCEDHRPVVNHLPLFYTSTPEPLGRVIGHMARANPQWRAWAKTDGPVLAVFQGPDAYISPSWYVTPNVPTWNYAVVQLMGEARVVTDEARLIEILDRLTDHMESGRTVPWKADWGDQGRREQIGGIVGFEIRVTDIRAKFKLGQNRSPVDQERVRERLLHSGRQRETELARLMRSAGSDGSG